MSARVTSSVSSNSTPAPAAPTVTGRLFIIGRAASGPSTVQKITGMAQFRNVYGDRVTNTATLFDVLRTYFSEGGAEAYVLRALGPAASGQSDDYANADFAALLTQFTADFGPGVVVIAGEDHSDVGDALGAHCAASNRIAIVSSVTADTVAEATAAAAVIAGYSNADRLVFAWPAVKFPTAGGVSTVEATGFVAGARARAHAEKGPWQSPIRDIFGTARFVSDVTVQTTDDEFLALNAADVTVVRVVSSRVRVYGYKTTAAPVGDDSGNLQGAQFRDLTNAVAFETARIAESYVGRTIDGRGVELAAFAGELSGLLNGYARAGALFARLDADGNELDPGFVVDTSSNVNAPEDLAAGNLKAEIGIRLSPTAEFVTIAISAGDAATGL